MYSKESNGTMSEAIIDITAYSYVIGDNTILKNVSLQVHDGEFISVIGPNGAGKSTLLNCIMRIYRGGHGCIELQGRDVTHYSQRALAQLISYIPQQDIAGFPVTVEDFVMMSRYPHISPFSSIGDSDKTAVKQALEITDCKRFAKRSLSTLSGGERRTISIAAALAQESAILLLDEPTTFLDPKHERDIFSLITKINREMGRTILMVTHDINHAVLSSDRICIIKDGESVFYGEPSDMMNNDVLAPVYGTSFTFMPHPEHGFPIILP